MEMIERLLQMQSFRGFNFEIFFLQHVHGKTSAAKVADELCWTLLFILIFHLSMLYPTALFLEGARCLSQHVKGDKGGTPCMCNRTGYGVPSYESCSAAHGDKMARIIIMKLPGSLLELLQPLVHRASVLRFPLTMPLRGSVFVHMNRG